MLSYLGFIQVLTHFFHKKGIIALLNREHGILKVMFATTNFTLSLNSTVVCRWEGNKGNEKTVKTREGKNNSKNNRMKSYLYQTGFKLLGILTLLGRCQAHLIAPLPIYFSLEQTGVVGTQVLQGRLLLVN